MIRNANTPRLYMKTGPLCGNLSHRAVGHKVGREMGILLRASLFLSILCFSSSRQAPTYEGNGLFAFSGPPSAHWTGTIKDARSASSFTASTSSQNCASYRLPLHHRKNTEHGSQGVRALRAAGTSRRRRNENPSSRVWSEVVTVSPEFCSLCQAQFEVRCTLDFTYT
jgi:hypothetical protein